MIYKLQNGWTIPLGGDYLEYLQNIPEVSGGSIQPSVKTEKLPEKFHGSQQAARTYAEGYQKGAKPVTKAIDNAGQKIFNTTKNVAMFVPGPTGAITWLGQMGADTANGEYSKVAKDLGAAVLVGAGLKGIQAGAKAVGRTLAGKGINIPWLDAYDYSALRNKYFNKAATKAISNTPRDIVQTNIEAGKLGWAPSSKQTLWHNSDQPLTKLEINFPAWDTTQRGAPLGHSWFTGTETVQGFMGKRPHHLRGTVELKKPMIQIGESIGDGKNATRNQILDFAQKSSADGINLKGIADNTLKNQDVYAIFKDVDVKPKLTAAEQLGIPKGARSNPKALEDPYYWGYKQWNQRYNSAINAGDIAEVQRLRDLHFKIKAPDTKVVDENGNPLHMYHGTDKYFTVFKDVNPEDIELKTRGYHTEDYNLAKDTYARGWRKSPITGKQFIKTDGIIYDDYLNITNPFVDTPNNNIQDIVINLTGIPQSNWGSLYDKGRMFLRTGGYDGVHVPRYHNTYLPTKSATQIKSAEPITWNGNGEIISIVKRDNFHNLDRRYKQGGILKAQNGFLNTWQKAYNSKFGKGLRDFMFGKDNDLSDKEYLEKYGYNKPVGGIGVLGALVAPEWEGLEIPEITAQHIGNQGKVLRWFESGNSKMLKVPIKETSKKASNWQKFLKLSQQEQDDFVRRWNGESFQGFATLKGDKQALGKFRSWINSRK